jgi:flagella basal body P-ring formation protein FlgA
MTLKSAALGGARRARIVGILTLLAGTLTLSLAARAAEWQSPDSIRERAREHVLAAYNASDVTIEAVGVDERLKLPACSAPLAAELVRAVQRGQAVVAVSCAGASPWRLFVPLRVIEQVSVVIARRALRAGEIIGASDLETRTHASTGLPHDYLTDVSHAAGLTLRRSVPAGSVLASGALEHPTVVERGALVTLVSGRGAVVVKSEGVALEPARLNERVRVRSPSGRVVEGVVGPAGEVRIGS